MSRSSASLLSTAIACCIHTLTTSLMTIAYHAKTKSSAYNYRPSLVRGSCRDFLLVCRFQDKFTRWLDGTGSDVPPSDPREVKVKHMVENIEVCCDLCQAVILCDFASRLRFCFTSAIYHLFMDILCVHVSFICRASCFIDFLAMSVWLWCVLSSLSYAVSLGPQQISRSILLSSCHS